MAVDSIVYQKPGTKIHIRNCCDETSEVLTLPETSYSGAHPKNAFAPEFNGNKSERLVARRNQSEFCAAKDIGRQCCELGLAVDSPGILLHQLLQLQCSKPPIEVHARSNGNQLSSRVFLENRWKDVRNKIDSLLQAPSSYKDEKLGIWVHVQASPFLGLLPQITTFGLPFFIDGNIRDLFLVILTPVCSIGWVRIWQLSNLGQAPEDWVPGVASIAIFLGYTDCAKAALMLAKVGRPRVEKVEHGAKLNVFLHDLGIKVENFSDLFAFRRGTHWPHALELGVV